MRVDFNSVATLFHTVRQNASQHISKVEFATELKSTRIKVRLTENELEKQKLENTSITRIKERLAKNCDNWISFDQKLEVWKEDIVSSDKEQHEGIGVGVVPKIGKSGVHY